MLVVSARFLHSKFSMSDFLEEQLTREQFCGVQPSTSSVEMMRGRKIRQLPCIHLSDPAEESKRGSPSVDNTPHHKDGLRSLPPFRQWFAPPTPSVCRMFLRPCRQPLALGKSEKRRRGKLALSATYAIFGLPYPRLLTTTTNTTDPPRPGGLVNRVSDSCYRSLLSSGTTANHTGTE